jgi:hypothetical protein
MAPVCFLEPVYSFFSAASFEAFDRDLTHKLTTKQLTAVSVPNLKQASAAFLCKDCQEVWILSEPDNAWRGFFLPQMEAIRHLAALEKATTTKQFGCLAVVALGILLFVWRSLWASH